VDVLMMLGVGSVASAHHSVGCVVRGGSVESRTGEPSSSSSLEQIRTAFTCTNRRGREGPFKARKVYRRGLASPSVMIRERLGEGFVEARRHAWRLKCTLHGSALRPVCVGAARG